MADEVKGVYVWHDRGQDHFESGIKVEVVEAHLYVRDEAQKVVAIFAPNRWLKAVAE
jgi:hypothetical protein